MSNAKTADVWHRASIVWIDRKTDGEGRDTAEVIYELSDNPDLLRQINMPLDDLYPGAKAGDRILVQPQSSSIQQDWPDASKPVRAAEAS